MKPITDPAALQALYAAPSPRSLTKVQPHLTPAYRRWIDASRFVIVSTVGPEGTDSSPRGDAGPVVRIADDRTVMLPDWMGNNRLDTLHNIIRDPRVSLLFMVPGSDNVVRINGRAIVTADTAICAAFAQAGKQPRSVIVTTATEVYFQCAKAIMRSHLWSGRDDSADLPTAGELLQEVEADFDADTYDVTYPAQARDRMW
ncbi:pyridoxamine 5'-phosphate oxidase family protein [Loktanella sp. SALINAS62]|uniref:pyridoxamine 5'-phosphate oxidase family protein n=1 Tax=Loktanella sp. SALINAS62 TaxID=2706124 RepID=UPI001B8BE8EE|nr:pyridoxamine 5'-phosphate oxidase family protein [Loktanella sp. SALINAS62]MBS1300995.1 pyridoxamine 5'-phosphate oxidase family protein [Loktanella sp. SALINAS62]